MREGAGEERSEGAHLFDLQRGLDLRDGLAEIGLQLGLVNGMSDRSSHDELTRGLAMEKKRRCIFRGYSRFSRC